jgi:hypothetical protein
MTSWRPSTPCCRHDLRSPAQWWRKRCARRRHGGRNCWTGDRGAARCAREPSGWCVCRARRSARRMPSAGRAGTGRPPSAALARSARVPRRVRLGRFDDRRSPRGTLDREQLLAGASRLLGPWFPDAYRDDAARARHRLRDARRTRRLPSGCACVTRSTLGDPTPPERLSSEQAWPTYAMAPVPVVSAAAVLAELSHRSAGRTSAPTSAASRRALERTGGPDVRDRGRRRAAAARAGSHSPVPSP